MQNSAYLSFKLLVAAFLLTLGGRLFILLGGPFLINLGAYMAFWGLILFIFVFII